MLQHISLLLAYLSIGEKGGNVYFSFEKTIPFGRQIKTSFLASKTVYFEVPMQLKKEKVGARKHRNLKTSVSFLFNVFKPASFLNGPKTVLGLFKICSQITTLILHNI